MDKKADFYTKLKQQLEETSTFPSDYMYKFIVPSSGNQVAQVQNVFNNTGAVINTKKSKKGTYSSVSIVLQVKSADEIISYYRNTEKIKGIISL